jgi:hypothetical protein
MKVQFSPLLILAFLALMLFQASCRTENVLNLDPVYVELDVKPGGIACSFIPARDTERRWDGDPTSSHWQVIKDANQMRITAADVFQGSPERFLLSIRIINPSSSQTMNGTYSINTTNIESSDVMFFGTELDLLNVFRNVSFSTKGKVTISNFDADAKTLDIRFAADQTIFGQRTQIFAGKGVALKYQEVR